MPPGLAVQPRIRVGADVRDGARRTVAGFGHIYGADPVNMPPGTPVEVFEEETGLCAPATVIERDFGNSLIYLSVDGELAEPESGESALGFLTAAVIVGVIRLAAWVLRPVAELAVWGGREAARGLWRWQCRSRRHPAAVPSQAPGAFDADGWCPRCQAYVPLG